jgi:uncharacterized membrane protein (UPF0182 family)
MYLLLFFILVGAWREAVLFVNGTEAGLNEPLLGLDAGFYLFTLPFPESLLGLFL